MNKKYTFVEVIGKGKFGIIYKAKNNFTNEIVAIKKSLNEDGTLLNEAKIYNYLNNTEHFPIFKGFVRDNLHSCLIIELMENNITYLKNKISNEQLKNIINQLINSINFMHKKGIVHRDLKPENVLISNNKIKLCDFGCSKQIIFKKKHLEFKYTDNTIGTPNYFSINMHKLFEPSRRDDLESIFYIIMNFNKELPWISSEVIDLNEIKNLKENLENTDILNKNEKKVFSIIKNLKYTQEPDYNLIKNLLTSEE